MSCCANATFDPEIIGSEHSDLSPHPNAPFLSSVTSSAPPPELKFAAIWVLAALSPPPLSPISAGLEGRGSGQAGWPALGDGDRVVRGPGAGVEAAEPG